MIWWSSAFVVAFGLVALGWRVHLWYCQMRNGCPLWRQLDTGEWVNRLTRAGWLTKNGKRHFQREERERHPTTEVATPQVLDEAKKSGDPWQHWVPSPPLDEGPKTGIPSERMETPVTGVTNPKRKTTP